MRNDVVTQGYQETIGNCSHWIFDLDGTLTVAVHDFAAIRRELDIPEDSDILGHLASLPEHDARPLKARLQEIELELSVMTRAAHGAAELLEHLSASGACLGILTRNTRENALRTLSFTGLGHFFKPHHVLGRDEALPKPDPEGIRRLIGTWGAEADTAAMVGDYLFDLQAGRMAGTMTVHVDTSRTFRWPELADVSVGSLGELLRRISLEPAP